MMCPHYWQPKVNHEAQLTVWRQTVVKYDYVITMWPSEAVVNAAVHAAVSAAVHAC